MVTAASRLRDQAACHRLWFCKPCSSLGSTLNLSITTLVRDKSACKGTQGRPCEYVSHLARLYHGPYFDFSEIKSISERLLYARSHSLIGRSWHHESTTSIRRVLSHALARLVDALLCCTRTCATHHRICTYGVSRISAAAPSMALLQGSIRGLCCTWRQSLVPPPAVSPGRGEDSVLAVASLESRTSRCVRAYPRLAGPVVFLCRVHGMRSAKRAQGGLS